MKVIVIGNSGSGKTWLAGQLNLAIDASVVHLDDLFREPGGFDKKRTLKSIALLRVQSEKGLEKLIQWASQYNDRSDLRSYQGHKELFAKFPGKKVHLQSEDDVNKFVANYTKLGTDEEGVTE